ncbi:phosphoenolpyruvate hydrolase family protein [Metaclostridioides mangenotii]|uniref:phosphoenolpyruvate hydrolase family protein n=1 Tax=Metaclostridioides mangenotii TaxID=1540 RepID=UPI0028E563C1|nr:phosphoenolpyruvate hydrolase family protein [Clostridioides mangenotii]
MFFTREKIISDLKSQFKINGNIIGVSLGAGIIAKYATMGGADLILALNSGKFRQMGVSSLGGMMPYFNANELVMDFASREILPTIRDIPIIFGLCATDPTINLDLYIDNIRNIGFSGIVNYPSIGMIDGLFREALEEDGFSYDEEVEAIKIASGKNIFTIAFVFNKEEAEKMIDAGADVICAHLGVTKGGVLGAKKMLSLESAVELANEVFEVCNNSDRDIIKVIYGGPVSSSRDLKYMYDNTETMGYFGGSAFERIPSEEFITKKTKEFKVTSRFEDDQLLNKMLEGVSKHYDYVEFVKEYVSVHYMEDISFTELAKVVHISRTHLSRLFNAEVGCSFLEYLSRYRINKAIEILKKEQIQLKKVADLVGYKDYAHFSKVFKKQIGMSPKEYINI